MLLDLGMDPYMVDKAIAGAFGMPMGPFRQGLGLLHGYLNVINALKNLDL